MSEMSHMSRGQVNNWSDVLPFAVFIDRISIMDRIKEELFNMKLREICFHGEKRVQERKHVMSGSPFQKMKNRKVTMGIRSHIHVEVVTEEIVFSMGIPAPVSVWLGIMAFAVTGMIAFFLAFTKFLFALRGSVTGKGRMCRVDQSISYGFIKELLVV